jgi:hypothetical protein
MFWAKLLDLFKAEIPCHISVYYTEAYLYPWLPKYNVSLLAT